MCGIFGTINYGVAIPEQEIFDQLYHRGPDQQGTYNSGQVSFYHTRLAIQDLSSFGRQPMEYHGLVLVFNGEIYNHMLLRNKYGLVAESNSDTLTILMLYELMGMKMLKELEGMFAFSLHDTKLGTIFLARDRAGKKPLYIYQKDKMFVFSSTLNLLFKICKPEINYEALSAYLYIGHHYRQATPYHSVSELENGHYLQIDIQSGNQQNICWFNIVDAFQKKSRLNFQDSISKVDDLLNTAVKSRIESSDLGVGCFLSGGIDSGIVTAMAANCTSRLKTFTVKIEGAFDESPLAEQVAIKYGTDHQVVEINFSNLANDIEKIISNHGEPNSDNSAIPSFYIAQEAKKHITVVLNGDGADELFAGYRRYVPFRYFNFFNQNTPLKHFAGRLVAGLPVANEKASMYTYGYRLLKFASYSDLTSMYCSASSDLFVGFENQFIIPPAMEQFKEDLDKINAYPISSLKKVMLMDFQSMLFGRLLPKMDIATMAHSLEGRSPFLSKDLLEFSAGMQDEFKIKNVNTKFLLRMLAKQYLPPVLINQPKRGFEIPLQQWVDQQLSVVMKSYLLSANAIYPKIIKRSFIEDLFARRVLISAERRAKILFCVFSLEVWFKNLPK